MNEPINDWNDDYWCPTPWGFGSVSGVDPSGAKRDVVAELRAVVEEVTGKPVEPRRARIGFLP